MTFFPDGKYYSDHYQNAAKKYFQNATMSVCFLEIPEKFHSFCQIETLESYVKRYKNGNDVVVAKKLITQEFEKKIIGTPQAAEKDMEICKDYFSSSSFLLIEDLVISNLAKSEEHSLNNKIVENPTTRKEYRQNIEVFQDYLNTSSLNLLEDRAIKEIELCGQRIDEINGKPAFMVITKYHVNKFQAIKELMEFIDEYPNSELLKKANGRKRRFEKMMINESESIDDLSQIVEIFPHLKTDERLISKRNVFEEKIRAEEKRIAEAELRERNNNSNNSDSQNRTRNSRPQKEKINGAGNFFGAIFRALLSDVEAPIDYQGYENGKNAPCYTILEVDTEPLFGKSKTYYLQCHDGKEEKVFYHEKYKDRPYYGGNILDGYRATLGEAANDVCDCR